MQAVQEDLENGKFPFPINFYWILALGSNNVEIKSDPLASHDSSTLILFSTVSSLSFSRRD